MSFCIISDPRSGLKSFKGSKKSKKKIKNDMIYVGVLSLIAEMLSLLRIFSKIRPFSFSLKQPKLLVFALRSPPMINILKLLEITRKNSKGINKMR
ncbi:hypothetical protein BpHYR1_003687 [Brachionus plicatilis]|uniref:Uncharacterized protein n=1 Tax=Brachionus plicatilis TaxID=10195 RepID=A0A3M7RT11_BRAPC|nr:hypothetical protein BpHYR1_003687 [Brachionus plicatilis]